MPELYIYLKWLHIVAACIAFGSNVTHFFWLVAANRDAEYRARILSLVKRIDDRLAVPAYAVTIACGATMWLWKWPIGSSWIGLSLILSVLLTAMGVSYGPLMNRWIYLSEAHSWSGYSLNVLANVLTCWWASMLFGVLVILFLMVSKPVLW